MDSPDQGVPTYSTPVALNPNYTTTATTPTRQVRLDSDMYVAGPKSPVAASTMYASVNDGAMQKSSIDLDSENYVEPSEMHFHGLQQYRYSENDTEA